MKLVVKKTKLKSFFKKLALLAVIVLPVSVNAQNFEWAFGIGGVSNDWGHGITTDNLGNIYTVGQYATDPMSAPYVDFDPGPGVYNLSSYNHDAFIQKTDASGNFVWVKQIGGANSDYAYAVALDNLGNIYVTGQFGGTADFDPGVGVFNLTAVGSYDSFVLKLDPSGNFVWAKSFGGTGVDRGNSISVDGAGNSYITGEFNATVDFNPSTSVYNLTSNGGSDIFIEKLDASGNFVWARAIGGTGNDVANSIKIDNFGNSHITGNFYGTVDFDPGTGVSNLIANNREGYVLKLDNFGNYIWAVQTEGVSGTGPNVNSKSIDLDASGNIFLTGIFSGDVDFNPSLQSYILDGGSMASSAFVLKLDPSGNFVWAITTVGGSAYGNSISVDDQGSVYVGGFYSQSVDFDYSIMGNATLTFNGGSDCFILKLNNTLGYEWSAAFGGTDYEEIRSICVDANGTVNSTGYYNSTVDFDPSAGVYNITASASNDYFVHQLSQCFSTFGTDVISACNSHTWIDGNTYTASNSTATHTLSNVGGCDSIVTLNLTIKNSNTGTDIISACNSHTWIDGITYTTSNSTATKTLTNVAGCDSIVTLNLTIKNSNTGTDVISACNSHTWIDGITYNASNTTATHTLTNVAGCDSIVTLNLTIKNSNTGTDVISACNSHTWIDGITYTVSNSTATKTLTNIAGCDSIVTLNLTINSSPTLTFAISADIVCATDGTLALTATPSGGTFSGQGVTGNMFDPSAATSSSYVFITYSYTDGNTCSNTAMDSIYVSGCVGLKNYSKNPEVKIYPNPTEGNFTIDLGTSESSVKLVVKNELGQLVSQTTYSTTSVINFNLQEKAGIYFIEITTDSGNTNHYKLIKH